MHAATDVIERHAEISELSVDRHVDRLIDWRPSTLQRWLLPFMWLAIGFVSAVTTPAEAAEPPVAQLVIAEVLGWVGLVALVGLVVAAFTARASLPMWSLAVGGVAATGLASCQMFGHPVFSAVWGLSQVALVSAGTVISGHMLARRLS